MGSNPTLSASFSPSIRSRRSSPRPAFAVGLPVSHSLGVLLVALAALAGAGCGDRRSAPAAAADAPGAGAASETAAPWAAVDCAVASAPVETLVCGDPALAALDRELAEAAAAALAKWPDPIDRLAGTRHGAWRAARDGCAAAADPRGCLEASYCRRLIELRIEGGLLAAPPPVEYACEGHEAERFAVVSFAQTEPKSAVVTWGDRQVVALAEPAAGGTLYVAPEVELREHPGETTVTWSGTRLTCRPRPRP